nr:hypothetical protein [Tanacetum cinerariifolium]
MRRMHPNRGEIAELDANKDVTLVDAEEEMVVDVQGRLEESQAKPANVEEVIEVVTSSKLMTEVVTTAALTITVTQVPKASAPRRRMGVVIQDPKETATSLVIVQLEVRSKDKGKGFLIEEPKHLKRQVQIKQDEAFTRQLEGKLNANINWNDVVDQVERKEKQDNTVMRYQALKRKPDAAKKQRIDEETEELKKQRIDEETEELKTHLQIIANDDDDVYTEATPLALKIMFEKPNVEASLWRDQKDVLLIEKKYPLIHFTLEKLLNNVRLEVEEVSEMSLELLSCLLWENASTFNRSIGFNNPVRAVLDIPNNNNWWIEEEPEEDLKIGEEEEEEEEEEEMDIEDEMDDPEIINPYEIEEGRLLPPPADSDTSSDSEPEVKAEDENEDKAATVGTITYAPYRVQPFLGTTYVGSGSSSKVFAPGPIRKDVDILHRKSVSTLEDQMRGLMLEDKKEKERLKKKLRVSQQENEQMEQPFHHVFDWIRKQFGVEIPPCMGDGDATTPDNAHPYEPRGSPYKKEPKEDPADYAADREDNDDDESSNDDDDDDDEDPAYYPADIGDNDDDESSNDDDDDDDVEKDEDDKEEEEHLAPVDPSDVSIDDLVPSS